MVAGAVTLSAKVTIDIWSDVMCPWCIIGYSQLSKALVMLEGEIEAELRWRPFELNPDMPLEGEEQAAHLARKYGRSEEEAAAGRGQMRRIARGAGYSFDYTGGGEAPPAMMWNTFLAHRLLFWALRGAGPEAQTRLKLALFDAHFQARRNISDPAVLMDVAEQVGLDRAGAEAALTDPAIGEAVRHEEQSAYDMNISGVPAMVLNEKFLIPGAQEPEVYVNTLRRVVSRGGKES